MFNRREARTGLFGDQEWTTSRYYEGPIQKNTNDCGVLVLTTMQVKAGVQGYRDELVQEDIVEIRERILRQTKAKGRGEGLQGHTKRHLSAFANVCCVGSRQMTL